MSVSFQIEGETVTLDPPPPGAADHPSVFFVGLPKAGSTLLNRIMRPLAEASGLTYYGVHEQLRAIGVRPSDFPAAINAVFLPTGYAFGGFRSLPGQMRLPAHASGRTVLLVRDPRDMLTSLFFSVAYSHAPPGTGAGGGLAERFEQRRSEASGGDIDEFVLRTMNTVVGQFRAVRNKLNGIDAKVFRYEDVVFDKLRWTEEMVEYLGMKVAPELVRETVAANDIRPQTEDATQHVRRVVPGDHAQKLKPQTIAALNEGFADVLGLYRYG